MTREQFSTIAYGMGAFVVLLLVWEIAIYVFQVPTFFVPAPSAIFKAFVNGANLYPVHLGMTVYSTLVGFLIAFFLAVVIAALISEIRFLERTFYPVLIAFQTMPRIALAPIIIVWFGYGASSKIALGALSAFFPIFLNMLHGLKVVDNDQIALMRTLRATRLQIFWKVKVPGALPFLLAGANIGILFAMIGVIVGEFLGANIGMGYLIVNQSALLDTAGVFATAIILSAAGFAFHFGAENLRNKLLFWSRQSEISGGATN
jgi:NitT/TauT family transport system permease protein